MPHFSSAQAADEIARAEAENAREHQARMVGAAALEKMERAQEQQRIAESARRHAESAAREATNQRR